MQSAELTRRSAAKRQALAEVRAQLASGELDVEQLLDNPPAMLLDRTALEALLMVRGINRKTVWLLNERAVAHGINLAAPLALLPACQRRRLAAHASALARRYLTAPVGRRARRTRAGTSR